MIRANDRVSQVLARDATLIDVFIGLSPAFERLRAPGVRKVMTRLVTVEQAARMGGVELELLLSRLNAHLADAAQAQLPRIDQPTASSAPEPEPPLSNMPRALAAIKDSDIVVVDVRDELRAGREPFSQIMGSLRIRPEHGALCVRAIFEPVPLYAVMQRQHLAHWTERLADDDWKVWFYPETAEQPEPAVQSAAAEESVSDLEANVIVLDVRGLEPPVPMMRTLEALEQLPQGATLVQLNVRVPQFLLPLLEQRGFSYEIREQDEDLVRLFIRHTN